MKRKELRFAHTAQGIMSAVVDSNYNISFARDKTMKKNVVRIPRAICSCGGSCGSPCGSPCGRNVK